MGFGKDISLLVLLVVAVFGVLITILALEGMPGQAASWTTVSQNIAPLIMMISFFGVVLYLITKR